ncbi:DUF1152 domain-containing protein [Nocardia donostiensis]|uniref:DUF1152 domain-containing protein n=1 Tax=Nocardia donostiensis TaxID=1538463 RepID=A0A1V2TA60_9NOCA|nr:DUF1152 domain-containing protein [Nocardia donostiensis]ONM46387.1 hypothetical protein B0T46_23050 [Nocardia donostiensis]OQS18306.1 hypothetical protein B0T44_20490 [Nocardia donostiensis]
MSAPTLFDTPILHRLHDCERILIAGAGGGHDLLSGLPIAFALQERHKTVFLANLTFTPVHRTTAQPVAPGLFETHADTSGPPGYFPEKHLAAWLRGHGYPDRVFLIRKAGPADIRAAYAWLARELRLDAVVLVDGGTDLLMTGDEAGLGTPVEDITSLLAAHALDLPVKLATCVGFGNDTYHGVCHAHFLENVAALTKLGAYHGVFALTPGITAVDAWLDAVDWVQQHTPGRESILCASTTDAARGEFGDHHSLARTRAKGAELFINPLMSMVWGFDLDAVANRVLYRDHIAHATTPFEVAAAIEAFRDHTPLRPRRTIPV